MPTVFKRTFNLIFICTLYLVGTAYAEQIENDTKYFTPTDSKYVNWVFLGVVENEIGETYNYFFQLQRNSQDFHVKAALFDSQTKKLIFKEDKNIKIDEESSGKWLIGSSFLRYYKTSNSWVFGLKTSNKQGFNFKVSMLNKPEDKPVTKYLQDRISLMVLQTGNLNGNIKLGDKDQFVTSKNTWFMQTWLKRDPVNQQSLSSLLCGFQDGRGLHFVKSLTKTQANNSITGLFDSDGNIMRISQFINIQKNQEGDWNIDLSTPKMHLKLKDSYKENGSVAGYVINDTTTGFCLLSNNEIG